MTTSNATSRQSNRRQPFEVRDPISGRQLSVTIAIAIVVLVIAAAVAWDGEVPGWEADALRFFNDWPDWLEPILWAVQQVGVLAAPIVGGLVIVWFTKRWAYLLPFVLLLPLKLIIEKAVLKQAIERERPFVTIGPDINVRGPAFEGLSFPSGHTTTAFAFAILLVAFLPRRWRPIPLIWAALVGISRLYFGEHNVLDVAAGAALGAIFGTVLWYTTLNRFATSTVENDR